MRILCAVILAASFAHASVVYDNGNPNGVDGNEATSWMQTEDFNIAAGASLTGATVYIGDREELGTWSGVIQYAIFADVAGNPGAAPIASGSGSVNSVTDTGTAWGFGGNAFAVDFDFASSFAATAGTTYWLGIHLTNGGYGTREDIYWVTTGANGTETGHESNSGNFNDWFDNGNQHAFQLNAPEPVSLALLGVAGIGIAIRRRRRA